MLRVLEGTMSAELESRSQVFNVVADASKLMGSDTRVILSLEL